MTPTRLSQRIAQRIAHGAWLLAFGALALTACSDSGNGPGTPSSDGSLGATTTDGTGSTETTGSASGATVGTTTGGATTTATTGSATQTTTGATTSGDVGSTTMGTGAGGTSGGITTSTSGGQAGNGGATTTGGAGAGGAPSGTTTGGGGLGGSNAGAGGSTTTGGDTTYDPCPTNGDPCKVMPLGDSITWGVGDEGNGGYRGPLFALTVAAGQNITFTGSLSNGPTTVSGQPFPQKNEGHSGWGISRVTPYSGGNAGIATMIPSPGFDAGSGGIPHIILLHIGTNDEGSFSAEEMIGDLSAFLDQVISNAPDAYLVVAQIIPLGYGTNEKIQTYNAAIPGLVDERAAAGKHIAIVDMYTGFNASTMLDSDNIHPNSSGYQFMADHWYSVIETLLPN